MDLSYKYELTKDICKKFSEIDFYSERDLEVEIVNKGIILPPRIDYNPDNALWGTGGVVTSNRKYIDISAQKGKNPYAPSMRNRIYGAYEIKGDVPYIEKDVFYMNYFIKQWGHYLIDVIGRLWYILDNKNITIVYTVMNDSDDKISGNYLEILKMIGIQEKNLIRINRPTQFKNVVVAESAIAAGSYFTKEYRAILKKITSSITIDEIMLPKKIYCSRRAFVKKRASEIGEHWIEKVFSENGYEVASFETLSVKKQIEMLNGAQELVMLSGSLQHNLLFLQNNVKVTVLVKSPSAALLQHMVNQISGAEITFVDVYMCPLPVTTDGPFWYVPSNRFLEYCQNNDITCLLNKKIDFKETIYYYYRYLCMNWRRIVNGTIASECPYSFRELHKQHRCICRHMD